MTLRRQGSSICHFGFRLHLACQGFERLVPYELFAVIGGIGAGFGLVMPFELAPFFFGARGKSCWVRLR
jgi:hypothetical protein